MTLDNKSINYDKIILSYSEVLAECTLNSERLKTLEINYTTSLARINQQQEELNGLKKLSHSPAIYRKLD